jgi:hypothetical protein
LISAAKVGKNLETIVSLPEKVVSNQEKCVRNMSRGSLEERPAVNASLFLLYARNLYARNLSLGSSDSSRSHIVRRRVEEKQKPSKIFGGFVFY